MSWNPSPTIGSASWSGNPPVVTKSQLLSTSAGIVSQIALSTISTFQTITATDWISTGTLYVSDIKGYVQIVSANTANFNVLETSTFTMVGPTINPSLDVKIDFNIGDILQGALIGTGALLFETAVGIGVGAGATFIGIGNGIAAMINSKDPVNNPTYINTSNFEVVGGSTQLQVSTIGNAYPVYSSIMRYVSSVSPNQTPGDPIFTSTLFYPGQICIRSISDPIPIVTSSSNLLGSTIQQFGEWVPFIGLETDDIIANSVSTNFLSSGSLSATYASFINVNALSVQSAGVLAESALQVGKINAPGTLTMPYESDLVFQIGATNYARQIGDLNYWWQQSDQDIVWSKTGIPSLTPINARLSLGANVDESLLQVSSIFSRGLIQSYAGFFSSLTVENLTVLSTINTTSTNVQNVTSTTTVIANSVYANVGLFSTLTPFNVSSGLGNPYGRFDITKTDSVVSTLYNQVSSLTQNILSYSLNAAVQDEASFNIGNTPPGALYNVTPANIDQWGSTILIFNDYANPGSIDLGWVGQWAVTPGDVGGTAPGGATFDVLYTNQPGSAANNFYITEESNKAYPYGVSTFYQFVNSSGFTGSNTFRFTLPPIVGGVRTGWWQMTTPAPGPYQTSNNNTFQIYQDINDTYIQGTDRLHIVAGDILLDGSVTFSNFTTTNLTAQTAFLSTLTSPTATITTLSTTTINASNVIVNPVTGGFDAYYHKSSISFNNAPMSMTPLQMTFLNDSPDYIPIFNLLAAFQGSNEFTSYNYTSWNNSVWNNNIAPSLNANPIICVGDVQTALGPYSAFFYINNTTQGYALSIYQISPSGSNLLGLIAGNTYAKIATSGGTTWTITSNVPNPQGGGGSFANVVSFIQDTSKTQMVNTQNLQIQAPNTTFLTGSMFMYADQIRVNSRRYGGAAATGLPSLVCGIENTVYIDANIAWTSIGDFYWQSDATNVVYNVTNSLFYDVNAWVVQVIPSRFRTNQFAIYSWDVQPTAIAVGGGGYCWGFSRYILVNGAGSGPGTGANNWNWILAIPKNYCTYT